MIVAKSSRFGCCTFAGSGDEIVGELHVPLRLRQVHRKTLSNGNSACITSGISLVLGTDKSNSARRFEIEYGKMSTKKRRGFDQRFCRLLDGQRLLCSATFPAQGLLEISTTETQYLLFELSNWASLRFQVSRGQTQAGEIYEKGFSLSRRLFVDLDNSIPLAIQCFMVFLVAGHS